MNRKSSAAARTISMFDGHTDADRPEWLGRDGSVGDETRRRRAPKRAPDWVPNVPPPGLATSWAKGGDEIRWSKDGRFTVCLARARKPLGAYDTLTAAIVAAEHAR